MKRSVITTFCLSLILVTQAWGQGEVSTSISEAPTAEKKFTADWRMRMDGTSFHDEQSQANFVNMRLDLRSKYLLTSSLYIDFQPSLRFVSGQSQVIDGADNMENKILLQQAALHFSPSQYTNFLVGALNQRHMHNSLLMDDLAFPAARAEGVLHGDYFVTTLGVETAIPTSTSMSTNTKEMEPTPSMNSASLKFTWQPNRFAFWKISVGYWAYANLPSSVAQQSSLIGNEVIPVSDAQYRFVYDYQGPEASTMIQAPLFSHVDGLIGAEFLQNTQAPSDDNMAYKVYAGTIIRVARTMDLGLQGGYFSIAPDASVSYFSDGLMGTNRIGYSAESYLSFKKQNFKMGLRYTDAQTMYNINTTQTRERTILLKLETFYADI